MKKTILAAFAFVLAIQINAQDRRQMSKEFNPEAQVERTVKKIAESVEINENQKTDLTEIFTDYNLKMKELREENKKVREKSFESMKELKLERDKKVKELFNDDSKYEKYLSTTERPKDFKKGNANFNKNKRNYQNKKGGNHNAGKFSTMKMQMLTDSLNLNQTQQNSLKEIFEEMKQARMDYRKIEEKTDADKQQFKDKMKTLDSKVETVLGSKDKYEQYKSLTKNKNNRNKKQCNNCKKTEHKQKQ